jgi:uncharacterized membrane protein
MIKAGFFVSGPGRSRYFHSESENNSYRGLKMSSLLIGSIGVGLLLVAFALNLLKRLTESSPLYLAMNIVGAAMAAWYAFEGNAIPFVVLELVWAMSALIRLILVIKKGSPVPRSL